MPKGLILNKEQKKISKKQAGKIEEKFKEKFKKMQLKDILTDEQIGIYECASEPRKKWLQYFVRCGDAFEAVKKAYPNVSECSARIMSSQLRLYFKISIGDLFRMMGIDELKIFTKTNTLLDAKRIVRRFKRGDDVEETEEEDNYAIGKGLDIAIKLTGNEPHQKRLLGEDPENKFGLTLADAVKNLHKRNNNTPQNDTTKNTATDK